jgi:flagellar hook-associated protein 3 FlgL
MRISTSEFVLGSLNDLLAQQQNVNQLDREIASGETMLDATSNPDGAAQVVGLANQIGQLSYDTANGDAATQSLQTGVSTLEQVTDLLSQLQQTASSIANGPSTITERQSAIGSAQSLLQQLTQLANTQNSNGAYIFAGSKSAGPAFTELPSGEVVFNGDANTSQLQIGPSLSINSTISGQAVFMNVPAGTQGIAVSASGTNTGSAYGSVGGITSLSQVTAASFADTEYDISFAQTGTSLTYKVTSGTGTPGSAGYNATSGVVASGAYTAGSTVAFRGIDVDVNGTPAAGDNFVVKPGSTASLFQTVQSLVAALQMPQETAPEKALAQQALQNVLANIGGAQTSVLSAQGALGTSLTEIQSVQSQVGDQSASATEQMSNLQSANMPQVLASYSESLTALQAAELAFSKIQNLSLFNDLMP